MECALGAKSVRKCCLSHDFTLKSTVVHFLNVLKFAALTPYRQVCGLALHIR